jgi:sugar diacid utilization regulator
VLVEDAEWRHLAAAGDAQLPSSVRPLLDAASRGRYCALADGRRGRTLEIAAGERRLGQISVFGDGDLDALEHVVRLTAGAIGVELAREQGGQPGRRRAFWERLATQAYVDAAAARDDASARGITLAAHYVAIALEPEVTDAQSAASDQHALREAALQTFRCADADTGLWERGATLFFFVPAAREIDSANARTAASLLAKSLAKKHPHLRVGGGVGSRVPFADLHESMAQASASLTISRRLYGVGRIGIHEELGAYPLLLAGADAAALREFSARTLAPLRSYDDKHQTELEKTLRLYFSVGENVKTAAEQLNVHRHTVFYRLRQIGEICACKLDDPHDQLTLRMAMAIDALTN